MFFTQPTMLFVFLGHCCFEMTYITMYKCFLLSLRHFFLFRPHVFSRALGSVARREPTRNTTAQVWALAEVRGTCSGGSKSQVPTGRYSEHVGPSRPLQTHVQVKRMSDGSCDIWDLECHQYLQTLLTWWLKSFFPTPTCQTCDHF